MPTISDLTGPAGPLEAVLDEPSTPPRAAAVFAHPHPQYGGTMHTKAVYQGAKGLARVGAAVLRFNFRGVGRSAGTFDEGAGEAEDFRAAVEYMARRYPGLPIWAAGFPFGAWIALENGAVVHAFAPFDAAEVEAQHREPRLLQAARRADPPRRSRARSTIRTRIPPPTTAVPGTSAPCSPARRRSPPSRRGRRRTRRRCARRRGS
jgi:alpha-beta hydrolase superfamily lysophospholipase